MKASLALRRSACKAARLLALSSTWLVVVLSILLGGSASATISAPVWYYPVVPDGLDYRYSVIDEKACTEAVALENAYILANADKLSITSATFVRLVGDYCLANYTVTRISGGGSYQRYIGFQFAGYGACPANSQAVGSLCICKQGFIELADACVPPEPPSRQICRPPTDGELFGAPIAPATGEKYRFETDFADGGSAPLIFSRTYSSNRASDAQRVPVGLGQVWTHNHGAALVTVPGPVTNTVLITLPEGHARVFTKTSGSPTWTAANDPDTLTQSGSVWIYRRADDDSTSRFDATGKLLSVTARNGWTTTYTYNAAGQLASISNAFGRTLMLGYSGSNLASITTPDARTIAYGYDTAGRLSTVTYPDGKTRSFVYENASFPQALTGIVDENGVRWGTFAYDEKGKAISTQLAGGASLYQIRYPLVTTAMVTDPLGTTRTYRYSTSSGKLIVTYSTLPSATGQADAASRIEDANGLITSEVDFYGAVTKTNWDASRRLPVSVTRASGTPAAQAVATQWHPTFSLPVLITEAGRTTAYTYDGQGNVLSQAITDTASSPNTTRTWQWTYNAQGLTATQTEPNGAVTTYTHDTLGNLIKAVNALGHETLYAYDTANRVVRITAPNGLITTFTYDARDRLLTQTIGNQLTTTLAYNPTGTVATLTLPGGLVLNYVYDAAHRLTGWSNSRGESGTFTLDAMGNRVGEQIRDSSGAIAWNAIRSINNMNRVAAITEGPNQTRTFGYDANGELVASTNGLNQSTRYSLDGMRRVTAVMNAANATATLAWDALDHVTQARDFKTVPTTYVRDAQGNATSEASVDTGTRSTRYDLLGLPISIVDALGQATAITRDLLGRPILLGFADGRFTTLAYDTAEVGKGYLASFTDRSGTTRYQRDIFGRITRKTQTLASGLVQQVGYTYTASGLPASTAYPDGNTLSYAYDGTGRLSQLNWNGTPLVAGLSWNPMDQPTGWNWASVSQSLAASRRYDTAGRLTATEFSGYVYDAAGRITSVAQQLFQPADTDPSHSTIASSAMSWNVAYDPVGRITGFNANGDTTSFGYDANGNRTSSIRTVNGQSTSKSYGVGTVSNQLTGFTQTQGRATTTVAYGYNANGDLISDGLRSYSYNAEGRLSDVTTGATDTSPTTRYAHNALGQRVFKTEPQYPPSQSDESNAAFVQSLINFFTQMWGPSTTDADKLGWAFTYDEDGNLLSETGTGGANSTGSTDFIYLPTANGAMPIAAVINGQIYAIHSDHLNTPRRIDSASGQPVWQWAYSAFGDSKPTTAHNRFANLDVTPNPGATGASEIVFNLRFPGQYFDKESGLFYNYFRSYDPKTGRYPQPDPIGLRGGFNRFLYVDADPLKYTDPLGLINQEAQRQLNEWFGPKAPSGNCATAECAAGLTPAPSENRSQTEVDRGQCKMVCQISLAVPYAACNAVLGGRLTGTVAGVFAKNGACSWVCK